MQLGHDQTSLAHSLVVLAARLDEDAASTDHARKTGLGATRPGPYRGSMCSILDQLNKRRVAAVATPVALTTVTAMDRSGHPDLEPSGQKADPTAADGSDPPVTRKGRRWRVLLTRPSQQRLPQAEPSCLAKASTGDDEGQDAGLVSEESALASEPPEEPALAPELQELIEQCMQDPLLAEQLLNQAEEVRRSTLEGARGGGGDAAAAVAAMVHVAALEDALRHRDVAACVVQLGVMSSSTGL